MRMKLFNIDKREKVDLHETIEEYTLVEDLRRGTSGAFTPTCNFIECANMKKKLKY